MLLLPHIARSNPRRIADPHFVPQRRQQLHEPLTVPRGLQADQRRPREPPVESLGLPWPMHQLTNQVSGLTPAVRKCIQEGSPYALAVGEKLYKLEGNTTGLDAYAGEKANVFGTAGSATIHVTSVSAPTPQG